MKNVYVVVKGQDKNFYKIDKMFENINDAKKYIENAQFFTSENLWIVENTLYNEGEFIYKYDDKLPLITAYVNRDEHVFKVSITEYSNNNKEQRFINLFTFYLAKKDKENLQDFLIRAKEIAIKKQIEYLSKK